MSSDKYCKELEIVKFICKDFWQLLFKKPVNGLRTNTGPNPKVRNASWSLIPPFVQDKSGVLELST